MLTRTRLAGTPNLILENLAGASEFPDDTPEADATRPARDITSFGWTDESRLRSGRKPSLPVAEAHSFKPWW
jgi:hypothetical protein